MATNSLAATINASLKADAIQYGRLGMRWGVRNGVGTPRASGGSTGQLSRKQIKSLGDEDLKKLVGRLQLEKQLKELQKADAPRKPIKEFVKELGKDILKTEVRRVAKGAVSIGVEKALSKQGAGDIADRIKPKKKK